MHYVKGTGFVEVSGKKVCSKREMSLHLARVYGFENDLESFTRLVIESRVSRQLLNDEFRKGAAQKQGGVDADYETGKWVPSYYGLKYTVARKTPAGSKESEMDASFKVARFEEAKAEADRRNNSTI